MMLKERMESRINKQQEVEQKSRNVQRLRLIIFGITAFLLLINLSFFAYSFLLSHNGINPNPWFTYFPLSLAIFGIALSIFSWQFPVSSSNLANPYSENKTLRSLSSLHSSVLADSVFQFNIPLTNADEFFGRPVERAKLISRISHGASTSIIGPRRIGKTWLIQYLMLIAPIEPKLGSGFRLGYLNATLPSCSTVEGFTKAALRELGYPDLIPDNEDLGLRPLENAVKYSKTKKETLVLCIDEFEEFRNENVFNRWFFNNLRAIASTGLVLVVASTTPLKEIVSEEVSTSPFFNIFENLTLKPFSIEEAQEFIQRKSDQAGFNDQERTFLGQLGEQLPLRLQIAGKLLLEDKLQNSQKDSDYIPLDDSNYTKIFKRRLEKKYREVVPT